MAPPQEQTMMVIRELCLQKSHECNMDSWIVCFIVSFVHLMIELQRILQVCVSDEFGAPCSVAVEVIDAGRAKVAQSR